MITSSKGPLEMMEEVAKSFTSFNSENLILLLVKIEYLLLSVPCSSKFHLLKDCAAS